MNYSNNAPAFMMSYIPPVSTQPIASTPAKNVNNNAPKSGTNYKAIGIASAAAAAIGVAALAISRGKVKMPQLLNSVKSSPAANSLKENVIEMVEKGGKFVMK